MSSQAPLAVVVLGFRARAHLEAGVLDSIRAACERVGGREVIKIYLDNYSRDGSIQWLQANAPDFDVLLTPRNLLYCGGVNLLLQYAEARYRPAYHLLVDADNPSEPDAYAALVDFMETHPRHGLAQPLVRSRSNPDVLYSAGHRYLADHGCRPVTELPEDLSTLLDLPSCSISSTIVRAETLRRIGLLQPVFEMYYESSDLCFRARAAGWLCAAVIEAVTYNEGSAGTGPDAMHQRYWFTRNWLLFCAMHHKSSLLEIAAGARDRLARLDAASEESPWGLGPTEEAERRGLRDGLEMALAGRWPEPPALDGFEKGSAVLLQTGLRSSTPSQLPVET